jgi:alkyl hydroperoxide reductase subunit AhpC
MSKASPWDYKGAMEEVMEMQSPLEMNRSAPEFHAITDAGSHELSNYRGQWLAMMYCPRGTCSERTECLEALRMQTRAIGAMGGQLLMLHPTLGAHDKVVEEVLHEGNLKWLHVGTVLDPKFLEHYQVSQEDDQGHGITGVFLIDPQGKLRAAARYAACAPAVMHEICTLMRTAIERFGMSGMEIPAEPGVRRAGVDANYGCVEWFHYQ